MRVLVALAFVICVSAEYPATYPYSKESAAPPAWPWFGEPYDNIDVKNEKNPGGYLARPLRCDPYSDDRLPYSGKVDTMTTAVPKAYLTAKPAGFRECGAQSYWWWTQKKSNGGENAASSNCTSFDAEKSTNDMWPDAIDGKTVCKKGECCKVLNNMLLPNIGRAVKTFTGQFSKLAKAGLCTDFPHEDVICAVASSAPNCIEYFPKGKVNVRTNTFPCLDSAWRWMMGCPSFKATRVAAEISGLAANWEHPKYLEKLSLTQVSLVDFVTKIPDRVCNPYSYYYPDSAAPASVSPYPVHVIAAATFTSLACHLN